jgi:hypothetical protein
LAQLNMWDFRACLLMAGIAFAVKTATQDARRQAASIFYTVVIT